MSILDKRILMIDEQGFYRVCSAILEAEGYSTELFTSVNNLPVKLSNNEFGLIILSYPFGAFLLDEIKKWNISTIVFTDNIDGSLINLLNGFENSYCMIKPLDYGKFRSLVREVMSHNFVYQKGYNIV
jgi:DNA-binding NtrC family response regulator